MNLDWEDDLRRLQRNPQSCANNSMEMNVGWKGLRPASQKFYSEASEVEKPKEELLEIAEVDAELARKRIELREIEERIMRKRASIALKKIVLIEKNEQPPTCKGAALRGRVKAILQQRPSLSSLSHSTNERASLSRDPVLPDYHPLKVRVGALMRQRWSNPPELPSNSQVSDVTPCLPVPNVTSPAQEETNINKGFQRFLSLLNNGVDLDLLSRIVTDDSEELPSDEKPLNIQAPAVESKSGPRTSKIQELNSEALLPDSSGERKTDLPPPEKSCSERHSLPDDEEKHERGGQCSGSSSRFRSSPTVKKKEKVEPEKTKGDEQREQLQNILKTLGLSLELEEMSKLTDRTQERLYGKKNESRPIADRKGEQDIRQRDSDRHYRNSSSSSSCSSSSRSTPRCSSPSHGQISHSRSSGDRREPGTSERSRSREKSKDVQTCQNFKQDDRQAQRPVDRAKNEEDHKETSFHQHPYSQTPQATYSAFPHYSLPGCSLDTDYHNGTYSGATDSSWTYTEGASPSVHHSNYRKYTCNPFPRSSRSSNLVYPGTLVPNDTNHFVNPDLSTSEGQMGSTSAPRCLQVITTTELPPVKTHRQRKMIQKMITARRKKKLQKRQQILSPASRPGAPKAGQPKKKKKPPTEVEIKANLRKKLEAFNQMAKNKSHSQPGPKPGTGL